MKRSTMVLVACGFWGAGVATGVVGVGCYGATVAQPLFAVGAWLANASQGPQWEISVEPTLRLATATVVPSDSRLATKKGGAR